uniref:Uncharacterized protein n=1 Tax=Opuntia streptacantha TaxID=393608 RepID=A0A7C9CPM0_OPUST
MKSGSGTLLALPGSCSATKASSMSSSSISPAMTFLLMLWVTSTMSHLPPYGIAYIACSVLPFFVASSTLFIVSLQYTGSRHFSPIIDTFMPSLINFSKLSSKLACICLNIR